MDTLSDSGDAAVPVLSAVHREYLNGAAISDEVIAAAGIRSEGDDIVFTWRNRDVTAEQRRMWPEPMGGLPPEVPKYLWETGKTLSFDVVREPARDSPALIVEGTKQHLAVASYSAPQYAVYGMAGCDGWRTENLSRFTGREVFIMLDADAATKLRVYEAGEDLAGKLRALGAFPFFVRLPSAGKEGADDFLTSLKADNADDTAALRRDVLQRLISIAITGKVVSPAARKPKAVKDKPVVQNRAAVYVDEDRQQVIHEINEALRQRWSGTELFSYGNAVTRLRGVYDVPPKPRTEPLSRGAFLRWLPEGVSCFREGQAGYVPSWPDRETIEALLASGDEFAPLDRIARTPFLRRDGSVCAKNGYDPDTRTALITGNSGMDQIYVPDQPSQADATAAASILMDDWLGPQNGRDGMPFRDEASRANALALILTPFVRGNTPLVPLAVVSGLQMGVGKNLLADCISLMVTGENCLPLPWVSDDDDEIRKQILAAFRVGSQLFCFDEAHDINSIALSRALTATTYTDRILGVSTMASYPNYVTWMALGNVVEVHGDMARRAYFIELYPNCADPQDRPETSFARPHIRDWTTAHRAVLVTAALTMLRAWYTAGQPAYPRGSSMGSFEEWDRIMSGALGYAGVRGFLGDLQTRRAEADTTGGFWQDHLRWAGSRFGAERFTTAQMKTAALTSGGTWEAPPGLSNLSDPEFPRKLGIAYRKITDRWFSDSRIVFGGIVTGGAKSYVVETREGSVTTVTTVGGVQEDDTPSDLRPSNVNADGVRVGDSSDNGDSSIPFTGTRARVEDPDNEVLTTPPNIFMETSTEAVTTVTTVTNPPVSSSLGIDLETADAGSLFTYQPHDSTGFVRLAGALPGGGSPVVTDAAGLLPLIEQATEVVGHNILGFDGLALAWHHGMDWEKFCAKARDTELIARQADPPRSRESGSSEDKYGLDAVAERLGLPGKTDDIGRLKHLHGAYDRIPIDDPDYRAYLEGDLRATMAVGQLLHNDAYTVREHKLAALAGRMTLNGFVVDQPLLAERLAAGQGRKRESLQLLHDAFGLPLGKTVLRGRGGAKHEVFEIAESPLATDFGREWLENLWQRYGIDDPPRTAKAGKLAIGNTELAAVAARPGCPDGLKSALRLMGIVTGTRTVYQTATDCLCPDGRVHPGVSMRQASGRWSVTNPGLTVFGKRGGKHVEREIFLPDPGHVLLSFDLSQVDMRSIAGHSQDRAYMALFEPGRDAHTEIARQVGIERQDAKAIGHGWNYGLGAKRMIANGLDPGLVNAFVTGMEQRFPQLMAWREQIRQEAGAGMILDNGFGRRMRAEESRAYTVAPALMGQGGARDIMCESLLRLPSEVYPMLRVMVHDEIVLSVPKADVMDVARVVKQAMTWEWRGVPILCDMDGGANWGDCSDH